MDFRFIGIQIATALFIVAMLWLLLKTLKIVWKLFFIIFILLALSFTLPVVRERILNLF